MILGHRMGRERQHIRRVRCTRVVMCMENAMVKAV